MEFVTTQVSTLRIGIFLGLFLLLLFLQFNVRWREFSANFIKRIVANISIATINSLVSLLTFGAVPILAAYFSAKHEVGFLYHLPLGQTLSFTIALLILDLAIYGQHFLTHKVPILWRLHKVHHSDNDLDVSTGVRFHPLEILFSLVFKSLVILVVGASPAAVVVFGILLNAGSMFNHSNIKVPDVWEKYLKYIVVTPRIHLVHHSTVHEEMNKNFGFTISLWDRLFGTYRPYENAQIPAIGLQEFSKTRDFRLGDLLKMPFK